MKYLELVASVGVW